jgi:hypothetical protein
VPRRGDKDQQSHLRGVAGYQPARREAGEASTTAGAPLLGVLPHSAIVQSPSRGAARVSAAGHRRQRNCGPESMLLRALARQPGSFHGRNQNRSLLIAVAPNARLAVSFIRLSGRTHPSHIGQP